MGGRGFLRIAVVMATAAGLLVPALTAPARTITVPTTLARSQTLSKAFATPGRATFDFAPTHVAFSWLGDEGTGIRFRTVAADGTFSSWQRAAEAHDAERGDRHFTGVLAVDRPTAIEWRPVIPEDASMDRLVLDYLNTIDGPRVSRTLPATAEAAATTPDIVTRAEWGADESLKRTSGGCVRQFFPVQQLFVHHTAGSNFDTRPKATMRAIYWYHVVRQGWCDVGYNFVIAPDGTIFEGRWARRYGPWEVHDSEDRSGRAVAGAHVSGYNSGSVGVSVMGNYSQVRPSPAVRRSLAEFLAWEADRHDLNPRAKHTYRNPESSATRHLPYIAGHRDAGYTECPGNHLYRALPDVRRDAATVMGVGKAESAIVMQASSERISYGQQVNFSGVLTDADGLALSGQTVRTYVRIGVRSWRRGPDVITATDGSFSFVLQPRATTKAVAVYDGDTTRWGTETPPVRVGVSPNVSIQAEGGTIEASGVTRYPAGTQVVPLIGSVAPPHEGHEVVVRIEKLASDGTYIVVGEGTARLDSTGAYRFHWRVDDPVNGGTYRAFTRFPRDTDHAVGISPTINFVIDPQT
ncbi:MAG: N-acetylmuramoyl-L-alanine amidase [Actinomycetota bacterium]|nr:N-acetylmuramoyl-L-alanine amidase [Actinomycetota bacterium]